MPPTIITAFVLLSFVANIKPARSPPVHASAMAAVPRGAVWIDWEWRRWPHHRRIEKNLRLPPLEEPLGSF